jgi:hypothetical protein
MVIAWNAAEWEAIGTVATALVALIALLAAFIQLRIAQGQRADQVRPFVVVDVQPSGAWRNILNLVVENLGLTLARDVRIHFTPPVASSSLKNDLAASVLLTEGIPSLPPRRRLEAFFDISHERANTDLPNRYDVEVTYNDAHGRPQPPLRYVIDIGYLFGLQYIEEYGMHQAAKSLDVLAKAVKGWTKSGRLAVSVKDDDRRLDDENLEFELTGHYATLGTEPPPEWAMKLGRSVALRPLVRRLLTRKRSDRE